MTITPDSLRRLADGLANQNSEAERVAARYAASAEMLEALKAVHPWLETSAEGEAATKRALDAIAKAERAEP